MSVGAGGVWRKRQTLCFPDVQRGLPHALPFFAHESLGTVLFTDLAGQVLPVCQDTLYEAVDHSLLWVYYVGPSEKDKAAWEAAIVGALVYLYWDKEDDQARAGEAPHGGILADDVRYVAEVDHHFVPCDEVFLLAEQFHVACRKGELPVGWDAVGNMPVSEVGACTEAPCRDHEAPWGQVLVLRPRRGFAALQRELPRLPAKPSRLHLRVRFYDDCSQRACHWIAVASRLGMGVIGVSPSAASCYCTSNHSLDFSDPAAGQWQSTTVRRSIGWHLFELELQESLIVSIDREPVKTLALQDPQDCESLLLGASAGGCAKWGNVEVLHTAEGHGTWEAGVLCIKPGNRRPWRIRSTEEGRWRIEGSEVAMLLDDPIEPDDSADVPIELEAGPPVEEVPAAALPAELPPDEELPAAEPPAAELPDEPPAAPQANPEDLFPEEATEPSALEFPQHEEEQIQSPDEVESPTSPSRASGKRRAAASKRKATSLRRPPSRSTMSPRSPKSPHRGSGLTVECWTIPGEADVERMDRVVALFVDKLAEARIVAPDNILRLEACDEPQHPNCHLYSFGTRRLHLALREGDGGHLSLVVRTGGGFLDFMEFARKHGAIEQLKLQRRTDPQGNQSLQLVRVLGGRTMSVKERNVQHR